MTDKRQKKPLSAIDYIKAQPSMQGKHPISTQSSLAEFPPLTYSKASSPGSSSSNQKQSSKPTQKTQYIEKDIQQILHTTHFPKKPLLKDLQAYTNRVYLQTSLWETDNIIKTQHFYEYILVDSKSAEFTHERSPTNPDHILYSKCKILRIASHTDLGFSTTHTQKPFTQEGYHLPGYTYTDYINAFFRTFYYRSFDHSWFISFHPLCPKIVPGWFHEWWFWIGPIDDIYPITILKESIPYYIKNIPKQPQIPNLAKIAFHIDMKISWIFAWHFDLLQLDVGMPMTLIRVLRVKWWDKFDTQTCSIEAIQKFFKEEKDLKQKVAQASEAATLRRRNLIQQYGTTPQRPVFQQQPQPLLNLPSSPTQTAAPSSQPAKTLTHQDLLEMMASFAQYLPHQQHQHEPEDGITQDDEQMPDAEDMFGGPLAQDPNEQ